jgi:hypothetical protein
MQKPIDYIPTLRRVQNQFIFFPASCSPFTNTKLKALLES